MSIINQEKHDILSKLCKKLPEELKLTIISYFDNKIFIYTFDCNKKIVTRKINKHLFMLYKKLNEFLTEKTKIFLKKKFACFINYMLLQLQQKKDLHKINIRIINFLKIIEKFCVKKYSFDYHSLLRNLNYNNISILICNVLHFVSQQPKLFQEMYIESFLKDCIQGNDGMTCAMRTLERINISLVPACITNNENINYQIIISIITANTNVFYWV